MLLLGLIQFTNRFSPSSPWSNRKKIDFLPLCSCVQGRTMKPQLNRQEGDLISIPFILLLSVPLSFILPSSLNRKRIFKLNSPSPWAYPLKTSIALEVRRWMLDFAISGRERIKENSGPPMAKMQVRESIPSSGMQPAEQSRGLTWWLEQGGISAPHPSTRCPGAGQGLYDLEGSQGRSECWSSLRSGRT